MVFTNTNEYVDYPSTTAPAATTK